MTNARSSTRLPRPLIALALASLVLAGVLLLSATRIGTPSGAPHFHGTVWEPSETASDFQLTDHTGRTVNLSDYRGKGVLLFFGYTTCPDVCPLTLTKLHRILSGMGSDAEGVQFLLVTVDPERDTPEILARYVEGFGPWVTGLTGEAEAIEAILKSYYAYAEPATVPTYPGAPEHAGHGAPIGALSHTPQVFGIDRHGEIRVLLPMEGSDEEIADDIRTLLKL